jgi:integrase
MGKSLAGKELGQGITQRKDGRYQARFTNRFGKRQTIYAKTLNEIRQRLRNEQYEDEKNLNVVSSDMSRKDTRRILIDMYNKAIDADLVLKNIPMQVNTVVNKDSNSEEPRVLTLEETDIFLEAAQHYRYFNTFSLALETGMRIGDDHVIIRLKLDKPSKYAGLG